MGPGDDLGSGCAKERVPWDQPQGEEEEAEVARLLQAEPGE